MQKRIYINFLVLVLFSVLLLAGSFSLLFFNASQSQEKAAIRSQAYLMAEMLNQGVDTFPIEAIRITIIAPDGLVFMESHADAELMDSRANRNEVVQAVQYGSGEAIRYSGVLDGATFYYAIRLQDGNVLRLSRTMSSLGEVFTTILPTLIAVTAIVLVLAHIIARTLTRKIIKPLSTIDLETSNDNYTLKDGKDFYEELLPYLNKINNQKQEIGKQMLALKNRADTIDAITANMQEGLVLIDRHSLILAANNSVLEIFNVSKESDILQKNVRHIYRDTEFSQAVVKCLQGTPSELTLLRNDRIYNIYLSPVFSDKTCQGAIIFFIDKTEQHKAENLRREFSANVSHELKTPLTTISALSEMMANRMVKSEDVTNFAEKISTQSKRLIDIIEDIIRLSEFDESKVERKFTTFDVHELAESVLSSLQDKANEKNVTLTLDGQPLHLTANNRLIDELLYNLIDNGIKYNKEGGSVTVKLTQENGWCKITVTDTGIGISKEHQARIFERFYRVDNSRSKRTGGTGLGLSIVKHIVEHHNGRIILESTECVGTTVVCYIVIGCSES